MSINLSVPQHEVVELKPRITVVGVGGAGGNAVNNMINGQLEGCEFIVANTDAQALTHAQTDRHIQLGSELTQGLGAGSKPDIGRAAAEEAIGDINEQLRGSHMVFIAAGMGGGTGTGAAPVVARAAREMGILTVGVVTKPFQFEGQHRLRIAEQGIEELEQYVDTLIIIPNQNLFRVANEKTTFADAFKMADDVLYSGVRSITDLMVRPGLINLDFADVRSVMNEMGRAMMGTGEAEGERRALDAAEAAIANPLLDDISMAGAHGVLINITGGADMTLFEVDEAANRVRAEVDQDAYIIFGSTFEEGFDGRIRVSVVATGIGAENLRRPIPTFHTISTPAVARPVIHGAPPAAVSDDDMDEALATVIEATAHESAGVELKLMSADEVAAIAREIELVDDDTPIEAGGPAMPARPVARMPAMPNAGAEDAFIPPAPVEATALATDEEPPAEAAAPVAARAAVKATVSRGPSLFEQVTSGVRSTMSRLERSAAGESADQTAIEQAPVPAAAPKPAAREPMFGPLDPEERTQPARRDDDLLDIPAFLRRQAN